LIIDRYADVLSVSVHSLGVWQRLPQWIGYLHKLLGTKREIINIEPDIAQIEGIPLPPLYSEAGKFVTHQVKNSQYQEGVIPVEKVEIQENGIRFEVDFIKGHKTGFFCDQRENRGKLAEFCHQRNVLDLCCYTGGFSLSAILLGQARHVTAVDLDPNVIHQAQKNAKLNSIHTGQIDFIHGDSFSFAREMKSKSWPVIILDPPKFLHRRNDMVGLSKYHDLNSAGIKLLDKGGLLVTCSCSGFLSLGEFKKIVHNAAQSQHRRLQILAASGAAMDHPVLSNCPEGEYLKVLWCRCY